MSDLMKVGADWGGAGSFKPLTSHISGGQRVADAHGRFVDPTLAGRIYAGGMTLTSISNVTFTTGTLGATCTPVAGVWNPSTSNRNLLVYQAILGVTITAATKTGGAPFMWASSVGNAAVSTGNNPLSRMTLQKTGSVAKDMCGVALTGLTNNLVLAFASALGGGSAGYSQVDGTVAAPSPFQVSFVENLDGSIVVPPGGVLALLATTTPVAHSAASGLMWEEVPLLVTV